MQTPENQPNRFLRFLKGERVQGTRGQLKWFATVLGLVLLVGLLVAPLVFLLARSAPGGTAQTQPTTQVVQTATRPPQQTPAGSATPQPVAGAPIKGLTDEPGYRWWRWPNHPQPDSWWGDGQTEQTLGVQIALMHELGVKLFRFELDWPFVAPDRPGGASYDSATARNQNWSGYHWDRLDMIVRLATAAGIQLVPQVVYSPDWASGITATIYHGPNAPPQSARYFGDFLFAAATRYKGQIHYWEMWNEEDYPDHGWVGSPQQYVDLILKPGYQAVKQVDPTALVVFGGLALDANMPKYYAAGAEPYFDIGNFHAYYESPGVAAAKDHVRGAMNQNGDKAKPVWLTEFGVETQKGGGFLNADVVSLPQDESSQARLIHDVFQLPGLQAIFLYQLHDTAVYLTGGAVLNPSYWGIVSHDLTRRKLGFEAYKEAAGGALPPLALATLPTSPAAPDSCRSPLDGIKDEQSDALSALSQRGRCAG
jgi:hypothetical protein